MKIYIGTQPFGPKAEQSPDTIGKAMRIYLGTEGERSGNAGVDAIGRAANNLHLTLNADPPLRILFSYHYYKEENIEGLLNNQLLGVPCDVFADSGAFSAFTTGAQITIEEYAAWLNKWGHLFTCAAALDVIGDAELSYAQTLELKKRIPESLQLIPIFHFRGATSFEILERYFEAGFKYVGMGGLVGVHNPDLTDSWLTKCFQMKPSDVNFHGFGVTAWKTLKKFPWYSVDSSSWTSGFRYARANLFDEQRGVWCGIDMRDAASVLKSSKVLADYNLRPAEIRADGYDKLKLSGACVLSWRRAEHWLTNWHTKELNPKHFSSIANSPGEQ